MRIDSLQTERLQLLPLNENHLDFIFELLNTEGWIRFIGDRNVRSREDALLYINRINGYKNVQYLCVSRKIDGKTIGITTLMKKDHLEHHDLGFAFLPEFGNQGYALEACKAFVEEIFKTTPIEVLMAETLVDNLNSIKLLTKLGMQLKKHREEDSVRLGVYQLSSEEFRS